MGKHLKVADGDATAATGNVVSLFSGGTPGIFRSKTTDGPPAQAQRISLSALREPLLRTALTGWEEICGGDRAFDRTQCPTTVLYTDPRLMTPRTCVLRVTDSNPQNWIFAYFATNLGVYGGKSFVGMRPRDFPDKAVSEASVFSFADAVIEHGPVAHEVEGVIDSSFIKYQRIAFPIVDAGGELFEMLTISSELFRVRFDA